MLWVKISATLPLNIGSLGAETCLFMSVTLNVMSVVLILGDRLVTNILYTTQVAILKCFKIISCYEFRLVWSLNLHASVRIYTPCHSVITTSQIEIILIIPRASTQPVRHTILKAKCLTQIVKRLEWTKFKDGRVDQLTCKGLYDAAIRRNGEMDQLTCTPHIILRRRGKGKRHEAKFKNVVSF